MPIASINPATGERLATFEPLTNAELETRLERAAARFASWRRTPIAERASALRRAAELLEAEKERWGRLMTLEMGKPLAAAVAEAEKCAWACRFYAEHAGEFLAPQPQATGARRSYVRFDPLGVVLAVMPWNFPFWQVFRFAAPALAAGNVGLLKHASNVPQSALALEEICQRAGFPEGCLQALLIEAERVEGVIRDPRVAAVTLTGSDTAGAAVAAVAGSEVKRTVLELGGSDPFVVMPSADLEQAAATAVKARAINNGQSCIAAKRFIVHRDVAEEFERRLVAGMRELEVGDPLEPGTDIGPLATPQVLATLQEQVEGSVAAGARLLLGGRPLPGPGNFYPPTVLADPPADSRVAREETFGPVATVFRVGSLEEAIALANASAYGLAASAWTSDAAEQERLVAELEVGSVFLNAMVKSDPRLPFGGVKRSGYGRELSAFGLREFVNVKAVWMA